MPGNQSSNGFYTRNRGQGGNGNARNNNRRRRPNNQGLKYAQANGFQDDADFQAKLPSDTAPAYRFVEKRPRRGGRGFHNHNHGGPQQQQHLNTHGQQQRPLQLHEHLQLQGSLGNPQHLQQHGTSPQARGCLQPIGPPGNREENVAPKTLRILPPTKPQLPETPEESAPADTSCTNSSSLDESLSNETGTSPPTIPESIISNKPDFQYAQTHLAEENRCTTNGTDEIDGGVPLSWSTIPETPCPLPATQKRLVVEEPIKKLPIRELLDTSDVIEPTALPKLPRLPAIFPTLSTPGQFQHSTIFSSPLAITETPVNPQTALSTAQYEPTPTERFLKISDVVSRYLTARLDDITYNPDLSRRLKADFEVLDAAYNNLPFDRSLNPYRIIYASLTALKRSVENRNADARVLGALKQMTQTYDTIRTQSIHERWLKGEHFAKTTPSVKPTPSAITTTLSATPAPTMSQNLKDKYGAGCMAIAKSGENLMETLKWNIGGGDMHVPFQ
ncbi:hypothetical protein ABW20_dc0109032 [Dactylellina cionopaga]|nr:hypothetical protein ABW20_dc0109032 [Dactylellina cionopaga]